MIGQLPGAQSALFYAFCLERHVPSDHLLRRIDAVLDLDGLRAHLAPYYSTTGRPSVDPELMIRMLIVGYCYGLRSERRLCDVANRRRQQAVFSTEYPETGPWLRHGGGVIQWGPGNFAANQFGMLSAVHEGLAVAAAFLLPVTADPPSPANVQQAATGWR